MCAKSSIRHPALAVLLLAAACLCICAFPRPALAKTYTSPQTAITADAQSDGSLRVVERRTFQFDGSFTRVWWEIKNDFTVNDVQIGEVDENGEVQFRTLPEAAFDTDWREQGGPGGFCWSHDKGWNSLYVFFQESDTTAVISIDYTVKDAVTAYKDCADLYWTIVGDGWNVDSDNVTCTITMPVPAGVHPVPSSTVYAWGHGPENGTLAFNESATAVTYNIESVRAGTYNDARVVFPRSWLTSIKADQLKAHGNDSNLEHIISGEKEWADEFNWQSRWRAVFLIVAGTISLALIVWAFLMWLRHGRDRKPRFADEYWQTDPGEGIHPCIAVRISRYGGAESGRDARGALLRLVEKGAVRMAGPWSEDPVFVRETSAGGHVLDALDRATLDFAFGDVVRGGDAVHLSEIEGRIARAKRSASDGKAPWERALDAEIASKGYFDPEAAAWQTRLAITGLIVLAMALGIDFVSGGHWCVLLWAPASIALLLLSTIMPRRSAEATEICARTQALRRWMTSRAASGVPPCEGESWPDCPVYAYLFGIASAS